jgi:hypothetical protein
VFAALTAARARCTIAQPMAEPPGDAAAAEPGEEKGAPESRKREHSWVVMGSVLGGAGTLLAAIVSGVSLFAGDGGNGPPPETRDTGTVQRTSLQPYARPYAEVRDRTGQLYVTVPNEWVQRDRRSWSSSNIEPYPNDTILGPAIIASRDINAFLDDEEFRTPGIFVGASKQLTAEWTPERLIEEFEFGFCEPQPARDYSKPSKTGATRTHKCPGTSTEWHVEAWWPPGHAYIVLVQAKLVEERDREALDVMLAQLDVALRGS